MPEAGYIIQFKRKSKDYLICFAFAAAFLAFLFLKEPAISALSDSAWNQLQRSGSDALDANKYWLAEPLLKQSVKEAEFFGFNDLRLATSLSELGRLYTVRGRFQTAQPFYEKELAVKEQAFGKDDGRIIEPMGFLIKFYLNYGTAEKADPLTDDLLAFVEGKINEAHFQNQKKSALAAGAPLQGYAGTAAPAMRDPLIEWAITCDSVADAYRARKAYGYADRLYKAALDIKSTVLGKGHLSLANSYDSLGAMCQEKHALKEAEGYYKDALNTTLRTLPSNDPKVYGRLDKLAKCLIEEGKYQEAEELYKKALYTFWKDAPSKTGDESRCLYTLGSICSKQKRYSEAANYLRRALLMVEKFSGPNSISLVPYLQQYAYVLYYLGRRGETAQLRARANAIAPPVRALVASPPKLLKSASIAKPNKASTGSSKKKRSRRTVSHKKAPQRR